MADLGDRNAHRGELARAVARKSADHEVEKALVELSSRVDHTFGELLMAAGRLAGERRPAGRFGPVYGFACLIVICVTIITVVIAVSS